MGSCFLKENDNIYKQLHWIVDDVNTMPSRHQWAHEISQHGGVTFHFVVLDLKKPLPVCSYNLRCNSPSKSQ